MRNLFFFLLACVCSLPATSYALPFKGISTKDGLSNRRVLMSAKDNDGYIWFATRIGIDRYNGESFVHYNLSGTTGDVAEFPKGIFHDKNKNIHTFSDRHIYRYSAEHDKFLRIPNIRIPYHESINTVSFDPMGHLWIGTTGNLYTVSESDSALHSIRQKTSVYSILFKNQKHGWAGTSKGIFHLSKREDDSYQSNRETVLSELNNKRIQTLYYDSLTQNLWIGTFNNGLYRYNESSKDLDTSNSSPHKLPIRSINAIGSDRIWVGMDGEGIYEYNRFDGKLIDEYSKEQNGYKRIPSNSIYHILENGNSVWISTYTGGVFVYNKSKLVPAFYNNTEYNRESLADNHVNCVLEDKQHRIWMGTNQGISRFDPEKKEWKHFLQDNTAPNTIILSLHQDHEGNVWAGGYSCDIVYIDRSDRIHKPNLAIGDNKQNRQQYAYAIYQDENKDIWIGGIINGLIKYSPSQEKTQRFPIKGINHILPFGKDSLLLASNQGVMVFNKKTKIYSFLQSDSLSPLKINIQRLCILPEHPNELWIGTEGRGVIKYDINTNQWQQYSQANGLSSNSICGLQYDQQGRLWISTENGLNCLSPKHNHIDAFYEPDGLPDNTLNFRSHCLLHNGHIVWGTPSGAFELNPDEYSWKQDKAYNLHFEEFALFNVPMSPQKENSPLQTTIDKTERITLKHNQHSFSFRFLNLGYLNAAKQLYSWYLDGFDEMWSIPTDHHHAVYTNIPPGKYIFHVKVFNGGNEENYQERTMRITILHPWWDTWMAWMVYTLLTVTIIYYLVKAYKNKLEARDSDQKIRFFINVAHDIRTPLTLIKAPLNEIEQEPLTDNAKLALTLAKRNTEKLLNMVTQLLDFQKIEREAMSLQVEETSIFAFINNLISNFEPLVHEKGIHIHTELSSEEYRGYIDQRKISIILDNLLSNSIKYTKPNGNVWIKGYVENNMLMIKVVDDGIGISDSDQKKLFRRFYRGENATNSKETGSGIGLLLTKKMALLHKGDISFSSNEGVGTTFTIKIPVSQNNYSSVELIKKDPVAEKKTVHLPDSENKSEKKKSKLLIVEDNEELRSYLAHYLSRNYQVLESANGQLALETASKETPDFIISDVMMPVLSGTDLCRQLKSNIETCHIPIILLTSLAEREDIINGLNAGADDYITKPFDLSVLQTKIAGIINNRRLYHKKFIDKSAFNEESAIINELDKKFMEKVVGYIEDKMMQEDFSIDTLSLEMAMSRSVFFKKIKSLTGQSPQELIRDIKMKKATTLLSENKYNIGEIAYLTGYPNAKYFSTTFKKYYGKTPSEYISNSM